MNYLVAMTIDETLSDVNRREELSFRYPLRSSSRQHDAHVLLRDNLRSQAIFDQASERDYDRRMAMEQ